MEDEGEEQGEDLGARDQRLVPVWRKSRGAPRGCWHEKTEAGNKPGTEAVQIRPRAAATTIMDRRYHHRLDIDSPLSRIIMDS